MDDARPTRTLSRLLPTHYSLPGDIRLSDPLNLPEYSVLVMRHRMLLKGGGILARLDQPPHHPQHAGGINAHRIGKFVRRHVPWADDRLGCQLDDLGNDGGLVNHISSRVRMSSS